MVARAPQSTTPEGRMRALLDQIQHVVDGACTPDERAHVSALFAPELRRELGRLCAAFDLGADLPSDPLALEPAPLQRLRRIANDIATSDDLAAMRVQINAYLRADGAVSLERCMHIRPGAASARNALRNRWLRAAAELLAAERPGCSAPVALHEEWTQFLRPGGKWDQWRGDAEPPYEATPLSRALFWASRANRSSNVGTLTLQHLRQVLAEEDFS